MRLLECARAAFGTMATNGKDGCGAMQCIEEDGTKVYAVICDFQEPYFLVRAIDSCGAE